MVTEIVVDDLGEGHEEASFVDWLVEVGERVERGEAVAEIMTDKVSSEIESPTAGILVNQQTKPDDTVVRGDVIGTVKADE